MRGSVVIDVGFEPMATETLRVVVADDSTLFRQGVVSVLGAAGMEVLAEVGDAEALVEAVARLEPDIAIVDIRMPPSFSRDGLDAAQRLRAAHPGLAVLLLSQYVEVEHAIDFLSADGGVGYLLKDRVSDLDEFADAVRRVAQGGSALDPSLIAELVRGRRPDPLAELTPRESDVLALIAEGKSNAAIARHLVVTEGAVEKHVRNIFAKLGLRDAEDTNRRVLAVVRLLEAVA